MEFERVAAVQRQVTYRPNPEVVAQRVGTQVVLVHLHTNQIYELNRTGARLWELVNAGCDRDELQDHLAAEFEIDKEQLAAEIEPFLALLLREELVTVEDRKLDERE